jgi:AAA+ ATPase superfamily predicted ATPase
VSANPFRYGAVARGEYFTNRESELRALLGDVRGGQDIVIFSPRRFGKTSLVTRAIEHLREEGTLVAYLDLLGAPSKAELADDLGQALYEGLQSPLEQALDRIRDFFSSLTISPRITVGDDAKPQLEFIGYEPERDTDKLIEGLLELPARVARDGHRVVVVFDEFQEIVSIDQHLPGQIRAAFQQQADIAHVYLGSKRHLMEPMFMERGSALYRSAKPMPLGPIAPDLFIGFLRERFAAGGVQVPTQALEEILSITGGRPYETQELCSFTWTRTQAEGRQVDREMIGRALSDLIDAESARYLAVWDRLSAGQRALLLALSREGGRVYSGGYRSRHKLGSASTVQKALARLEQFELVEPLADGGYAISDVFLRDWLRRLD